MSKSPLNHVSNRSPRLLDNNVLHLCESKGYIYMIHIYVYDTQIGAWIRNYTRVKPWDVITHPWASYQIRKIAGAHAPGMPGTFSPSPHVSDPDMHHDTCVTHVPWCMPGSLTSGFIWNRRRGKTFPAFPAHAQPAGTWLHFHGNRIDQTKHYWILNLTAPSLYTVGELRSGVTGFATIFALQNVQLCATLTRSNITRYCIHHCSDRGRIWIRHWI